jgi:hypothetical protein
VFLGRGFTGRGLGFGVGGNVSIWVETADGAIAFTQNATAFFDERLDILDKLLFVKLVLGCSVGLFNELQRTSGSASDETKVIPSTTYICDLFANRLHLLQGLVDDVRDLLGHFSLFLLLHLFGCGAFFLLFRNVFEQRAFTDLVAVLVHHVPIIIDLFTDTCQEVAVGESANRVTILVAYLSFTVDT